MASCTITTSPVAWAKPVRRAAPLPSIAVMEGQLDAAVRFLLELFQDFARAVGRKVVHNKQLLLQAAFRLQHGSHHLGDRGLLVIDRHDHRDRGQTFQWSAYEPL